jgi:hypothetical protein
MLHRVFVCCRYSRVARCASLKGDAAESSAVGDIVPATTLSLSPIFPVRMSEPSARRPLFATARLTTVRRLSHCSPRDSRPLPRGHDAALQFASLGRGGSALHLRDWREGSGLSLSPAEILQIARGRRCRRRSDQMAAGRAHGDRDGARSSGADGRSGAHGSFLPL